MRREQRLKKKNYSWSAGVPGEERNRQCYREQQPEENVKDHMPQKVCNKRRRTYKGHHGR